MKKLSPASSPEDIRNAGWMVATHNDYTQGGKRMTFWLFTKDGRAVKGEGTSDAISLNQVRKQIGLPVPKVPTPTKEQVDHDEVAKHIVTAFYLYGGYKVDSRGPAGCLLDALNLVAPHIRADFSCDEAHTIYHRHWPEEGEEEEPEPSKATPKGALYCDHANETPRTSPCDCPSDCYCKNAGMCRSKRTGQASG